MKKFQVLNQSNRRFVLTALLAMAGVSLASSAWAARQSGGAKYRTVQKYRDRYGLPTDIANDEDKPLVKAFTPRVPGADGDKDSAFIQEFTQEADFFDKPLTSRTWKEGDEESNDISRE